MQEAINTLLRQLKELEKRHQSLKQKADELIKSLTEIDKELIQNQNTQELHRKAIQILQEGKSSGKVKKQKPK